MPRNQFCSLGHLRNEAGVEQKFVVRLLEDLGYSNGDIRSKESLEKLKVPGRSFRQSMRYRPDFALQVNGVVRWIIEAKAPNQSLDAHVLQPEHYCHKLNGEFTDSNPVEFYLLTNGRLTRLYRRDVNEPILELAFDAFNKDSASYLDLRGYLAKSALGQPRESADKPKTLTMSRAPIHEVNSAFAWCHQHIYRSDNISQGAAFGEFVKIIALKLLSDKKLLDRYPHVAEKEEFEIDVDQVGFSKAWLEQQEKETPNPLNTIRFRNFLDEMERAIALNERRRIFEKDDEIALSPDTIKDVVGRLEKIFLFGIDADLNGRLFETFLNATMRGKDLGQYFTPRSIVKLGVGLGAPRVNARVGRSGGRHSDKVLDGCCGTGGFLIDALADMWNKVDDNLALSSSQREKLKTQIANEHIFGVDVGKSPNLSRIARLNMYLHGDGGSQIYNVDALDKEIPDESTDSAELTDERRQLRKTFHTKDGYFDLVLTNPPFAKTYSLRKRDPNQPNEPDNNAARILKQYAIRERSSGKPANSLKSSTMFFERYSELLKPGGRLVSVVDDGLLGASKYAWFRAFLRSRYIVEAVVSLPGDAFQRSNARVKTSLIVLRKRVDAHEEQPSVFMYPCCFVGNDDPARERRLPGDDKLREQARNEIREVVREFNAFCDGRGAKKYTVPANAISNRLDVKHCLEKPGSKVPTWRRKGIRVLKIKDVVSLKDFDEAHQIHAKEYDEPLNYLRVKYDGSAIEGDTVIPSETSYSTFYVVETDDIVISNIAVSYGSIAVVPPHLAGCIVTNEYTVLRAKDGYDPRVIWAVLRSAEVRADLLLVATGSNRTRIRWSAMADLMIPFPDASQARKLGERIKGYENQLREIERKQEQDIQRFSEQIYLDKPKAKQMLAAYKPPR